jgi:hypothetical protein
MMELMTTLIVAFSLLVSELPRRGENITVVMKQTKAFYDRIDPEPDRSPPALSSRR